MRGLAAVEVLAVWERAGTCPAARRPAELLAAVIPDGAWDLPLGARDAALLRLFAATFGDRLDALSTCPSCGTVVDLTLSCAELAHGGPGAAA
jgi:hypothetical protein